MGLDRSKALLIFRAISAPLAHRGERARLAVAVLVAALLGLDVRVDPVRERGADPPGARVQVEIAAFEGNHWLP